MATARVLERYHYRDQELGQLVESASKQLKFHGDGKYTIERYREFQTDFGEFDAVDLVREMSPQDKIHMQHNAYGVYRLLEHFGINPDDYIEEEDLVMYVLEKGYKSLTDLNRGDHRAWELVKQKGLETKLFPELQPAD